MIRIALRNLGEPAGGMTPGRRPFGLDTPLLADPQVIERAVLRHLAEHCPSILVLAVKPSDTRESQGVDLASGVPDLLLLLPEGRLACIKVKTQAQMLSRAQRAFADLCRERGIPFHVVRSLPEARAVLDRLSGDRRIHG